MKNIIFTITLAALLISSCSAPKSITEAANIPEQGITTPENKDDFLGGEPEVLYQDPHQPIEARVDDLLSRMTLAEKIGQMTQVEKGSITPSEVKLYSVGSVLSGGGGGPSQNTAEDWADMVDDFQEAAHQTRLRIPLIYGVDAVHGHANLKGATIFPQNIGLGAAGDPDLMFLIGEATSKEMWATGIPWNFGPVVAVPQDIRWGRTYEGYSENTDLVTQLAIPYLEGLQTSPAKDNSTGELRTLGTAKHYIGDGGTTWGTATAVNMGASYKLDQGDMQLEESQIRELFLPPYQAALDAGALSVMASFNSWDGVKLHGHDYLLNEVLKDEMGFRGFIVSDWQGVDQISGNYYDAVVTAINAGIDMNMVPYTYLKFIETLTQAVENGDVPVERIDDAVRRILTVKFKLGLFETAYSQPELLNSVGSAYHRTIAREAVRKSLVLLKNENDALPISKDSPIIFVAGAHADDIGLQSGGWTIEWQGKAGNITPGTTILEGIQDAVSTETKLIYSKTGDFYNAVDDNGDPLKADVTILLLGEQPYAEGVGDRADLRLTGTEIDLIKALRQHSDTLVLTLVSGRPLVITDVYPLVDGIIAAWLPGSEGNGVADVLFGDYPFRGKTPYTWPRNNEQLPININNIGEKSGCNGPLFPFGYGLGEAGSPPIEWIECP
ncbi:glycoside hydrolase family 3 protein [Chloroflexota bacterium]